MLETLSHLHDLHLEIRGATKRLSRSHNSMVCRAVSSSIADVHLGEFLSKITQTESAILRKDAGYVGAYEIVPLSTVVSEFAPWTRRLEWLRSIVQHLDPDSTVSAKAHPPCAASILDLLEKERHTGYSDIEGMAVALLTVAQNTWMRAVSLWVLYGRLPTAGAPDFCIRPNPTPASVMDSFILVPELTPALLKPSACHALLSAGSALNQLRTQASGGSVVMQGVNDLSVSLLQRHLAVLGSLQYPLNPSLLENALSLINNSLSENALSQFLPRPLVLQLLQVLWRYMLLGQGEFAVSLIAHADERVVGRHPAQAAAQPLRKVGTLDDLSVKDPESSGILAKALTQLATFQTEDDLGDDALILARKILSLRAVSGQHRSRSITTLLPTPTHLQLHLPTNAPLHMFLSAEDATTYASINAYLLSIHRAELHLSALWKLSSQRRCHPAPLGPPRSASEFGKARLGAHRVRDARRNARTRGHWSCASKLLFLINELEVYLQGEVIHSSTLQFREWLDGKDSNSRSSRPGTASSAGQHDLPDTFNTANQKIPADPRAMAEAHRKYLHAMNSALFLTNDGFITILKELLNQVDHLVALFYRLQTAWQGLDLQDDEGVVDAFSNYAQDESEVLAEMDRTRSAVELSLADIVEKIRDIEKEKRMGAGLGSGINESLGEMNLNGQAARFVPWQARTVDRLVMKLDGLARRLDDERDALADDSDDE
jgi:hypothetical protein